MLVSGTTIAVTSAIGLRSGVHASERLLERRLVSIAAAEQWELRAAIEGLRAQVAALAASPTTAESIERLAVSDRIALPDRDRLAAARDELRAHTRDEVLPVLERASAGTVDPGDLLPDSDAGIHLQHEFLSAGPGVDPIEIDVPPTESPWATAHAELHPEYRGVVDHLGVDDLYLIDAGGDIVYSVAKRSDFATNLASGTHSGGTLGLTFRQLRDGPGDGPATVVTDMSSYAPALGRPAWFMAAPVTADGELVGVLAVRLGLDQVHDVLATGPTRSGDDTGLGFGETGELYLAGADTRLRSDPRDYRSAPSAYVADALAAGTLADADADIVDARRSTVGQQRTDGDVVAAALGDGEEGIDAVVDRTDHLGRASLMHATPLGVDGLDWVLVSQITRAEAHEPIDDYRRTLLLLAAALVAVITFGGVAWGNRLALPVRTISERMRRRRRGDPDDGDDRDDDDDDGGGFRCQEFARLAHSLAAMDAELAARRAEVARAHDEWVATLRSLLPAHLARRVDAGDPAVLDVASAASVTVLVLHGVDAAGGGRAQLDAVLGAIDTVAARHGVERVKLLGDTCFTVVGHRQPMLDHARRASAFAHEAIDAIAGAPEVAGAVTAAAGVASGPVWSGLGGSTRLVYDIWGRTAAVADELARRAAPGAVEIDATTAERLPDHEHGARR